jgi:hypothetical protein
MEFPMSTHRPPHYLTENEFARLRLTDDQWHEMAQRMELSVLERAYFGRTYDPLRSSEERASSRNEKVVFVALSILAGGFFTLLVIGGIAALVETPSVYRLHNPLTYMIAAVVAAWFMADD